MNEELIHEITANIKKAKNISVLTGAGISTASGIPDFRGKDGLYNTADMEEFHNLPPESMLSHSMLEGNPEMFYKWYRKYMDISAHQPSEGHLFLSNIEHKLNKNVQIFTQNIDGLHTAAGSTTVYELHGNGSVMRCEDCGATWKTSDVFSPDWKYTNGNIPLCKCGSILRPDIVLYDEPINAPHSGLYREMLRDCDLFLIMGTSLAVYPASSIPNYCYIMTDIYIINDKSYPEFGEALTEVAFKECIMDINKFISVANKDLF